MLRFTIYPQNSVNNKNRTVLTLKWTFLLIILYFPLNAQVSLPLNNEILQQIEPSLLAKDPSYFTALKPYDLFQLRNKINPDSLLFFGNTTTRHTWFGRKLLQESFLQVDSSDFVLTVDPIFNFSMGKETGNKQKLYTNTRGLRIRGSLGKTIGFESSLYENQAFFPELMDSFITKRRIIPGQGRAKPYQKTGWDYAYSSGCIEWRPGIHFSVKFALDKIFIGDGYRTLLLSDFSSNFPFIMFTLNFKNFQYTRITASLTNIDYSIQNKDIGKFPGKTANFHLLSTNLFKKIQLSLFEGTVLKNPDNMGKLHPDYNLFAPIPFSDLFTTGDKHSLAGINLKMNVTKSIQLYNQWAFDDLTHKAAGPKFGTGNFGVQGGLKYFDAFGIRNINIQGEYNLVKPNTYSYTDTVISYTHYSQSLAHPLGEDFKEGIFIISYHFKRIYAEYKLTSAVYGKNNGFIFHEDGLLLFSGNSQPATSQTQKSTLQTQAAYISLKINPATNSAISVGINIREEHSKLTDHYMKYFYFCFSTNLRNIYSDF